MKKKPHKRKAMDDLSIVYEWAKTSDFDESEQFYCTLLALKILDNACKMDYDNYNLFMSVYDGISDQINTPFNKKVHTIIELARCDDPIIPKDEFKESITILRKTMMKNMEKSKMKAFKQKVWGELC
jgi:hypothetical protein